MTCTRTRGADAPRNVTNLKAFMNKDMHNIDHGNSPIPGQYNETKVGEGSKVLMPSPQRQHRPVQFNDLWIKRLPMRLLLEEHPRRRGSEWNRTIRREFRAQKLHDCLVVRSGKTLV